MGGRLIDVSHVLAGRRGLVWCQLCGAWGTLRNPRVENLGRACAVTLGRPPTTAGRSVLSRVARGLTPTTMVVWPSHGDRENRDHLDAQELSCEARQCEVTRSSAACKMNAVLERIRLKERASGSGGNVGEGGEAGQAG